MRTALPLSAVLLAVAMCWACVFGSVSLACIDYADYLHDLGSVETPNFARNVAVSGTYAYIADEDSGLQVSDITDPANPWIVGHADTPGCADDVAVAGIYAYVADGTLGLRVIEISNPHSPGFVGIVDTPGPLYDVAILDAYVYVADGLAGLRVIYIAHPETAQIVGSLSTGGDATGVSVSDSESLSRMDPPACGSSTVRTHEILPSSGACRLPVPPEMSPSLTASPMSPPERRGAFRSSTFRSPRIHESSAESIPLVPP